MEPPANICIALHYPVEACTVCGWMVYCQDINDISHVDLRCFWLIQTSAESYKIYHSWDNKTATFFFHLSVTVVWPVNSSLKIGTSPVPCAEQGTGTKHQLVGYRCTIIILYFNSIPYNLIGCRVSFAKAFRHQPMTLLLIQKPQ